MNVKIGIITIVKVNNYGAELQAYATQRKLSLMGYDAELIDYRYYKSWNFKDTSKSVPLMPLSKKEKLMYILKYRVVNWFVDCVLPLLSKNVKRRLDRFSAFHKNNTKFSRTFISMNDLYENAPKYEVYITGSDQVWNPSASSSIEPYFLTFAPQKAKKLSYASSFGVEHLDGSLKDKVGNWLNQYNHISVRENSGIGLVKELSGKDAEWVIDPTLLLTRNEWGEVAKVYPNISNRYVLIYDLADSATLDQLALKIGKERNIPVYRICKRSYGMSQKNGIKNILDAGPAEYLSLFEHAEYIVTNSFHGTAFSVNFGKPFFTVLSNQKKNNARMESLLGMVQLMDRIIWDNAAIDTVNIDSAIDFQKAHEVLQVQREKSEAYLKTSLC